MAALAGPVGQAVEVSASPLGGARALGRLACRPEPVSAPAPVRWRRGRCSGLFLVLDGGGCAGEEKASAVHSALCVAGMIWWPPR